MTLSWRLAIVLAAVISSAAPAHAASARPAAGSDASGAGAPLVAVDVGHSLSRPGATSARGIPEFRFNQSLAQEVAAALQRRGLRALLIGEQGDADSLVSRTAAATAAGADLLLSVHHDSVQPQYLQSWQVDGLEQRYADRFSGFSLLVSRRNPSSQQSLACAQDIGTALRAVGWRPSLHHAEPIAGESLPLVDAANGIYWYDNLVVLKTASSPAVLLEAGIIVNRADEQRLGDARQQARMAAAVADGVVGCLAALKAR